MAKVPNYKFSAVKWDGSDEQTFLATQGDYLRAQIAMGHIKAECAKAGEPLEFEAQTLLFSSAWAFCAMKRTGLLEQYGLDDELSLENLLDMGDAIYLSMDEEGETESEGTDPLPDGAK